MQAKLQSKESEIRRKLDNSGITKPAEFEEIIAKLIGQKERLQQDLRMLREKVVALHQRQAAKIQIERMTSKVSRPKLKAKPSINYREELNRKHEELKLWQKRVLRATKNEKTQVEHRQIMNRLASIEQQIGLELQRYSDEKMTYKRLRKALKLFDKQDEKKSYLQDGMQRENKLLKKRVFSLKKIVDNQISKQIDLQTHLVDIREKQRYIEQLARNAKREESQLRSSRHSKTIERHRTQVVELPLDSLSDDSEKEDTVSFQIVYVGQNLSKDQIYQLEGHLNRKENKFREDISKIQKKIKKNYPNQALNILRQGSKLSFGKELDLVLDHCRKAIHKYADLNREKIKLLLQKESMDDSVPQNQRENLRYASTSIARGLRTSELSYHSSNRSAKKLAATITPLFESQSTVHANQRQKLKVSQKQVQTENQSTCLRRQFIGQIKEDRTDDRQLLGNKTNCSIRALKIYCTDRGIASIQGIYNLSNGEKTMDGRLILPQNFIQNYCKVHTIEAANDDFIRYFKLRYHTQENRITSIRVVTNRNVKNGYGQAKSLKEQQFDDINRVEKQYIFDIGRDEFACSIFCSHMQKGPYWYLCGFGAQIDEL